VNHGGVKIGRLQRSLAGLPLPRAADGRLVLAADVATGCGRARRLARPVVLPCLKARQRPGADDPWLAVPVIAALESGRTSWTAVLDAVRLGPSNHETDITAQVRDVVGRVVTAGYGTLEATTNDEALSLISAHDCQFLLTGTAMSALADRAREIRPSIRVLWMMGSSSGATAPAGSVEKPFIGRPFTASGLLEKYLRHWPASPSCDYLCR
jgi:hypothetical protein